MTSYRAPVKDFDFILYDVLDITKLSDLPGYSQLSRDTVSMLLESAAELCEEVIHPLNALADREGCHLVDGRVVTPAAFKKAYRTLCEGGWMGLALDEQFGGQGLPGVLGEVFYEMLASASVGFSGYPELTHATFSAILAHGSPEQQALYLGKLASGEWAGAMHLTEAQAGTDLGLIQTTAVPLENGTYSLTGSKIFITAADHDLAENLVALVLARIKGAPAGSKGLSLFIVPTLKVGADGLAGDRNAVAYSSLEHKMGMHAQPTGTVNYEGAIADLVGEPGRGLTAMFTMMNDARLGVALQGLGISEIAYQNAAAYAKDRLQGRSPTGPARPDLPADPIIMHAGVRRDLMLMRSFNEGARALGLFTAMHIDISHIHDDALVRQASADLVGLLTPAVKAYFSDCGCDSADRALQCFGGHGYVRDTGVEQFLRDVRVARIYEGTNDVQALDLARRKLALRNGTAVEDLFERIDVSAKAGGGDPLTAEFGTALATTLSELKSATAWLRDQAPDQVAASSADYLKLFALTCMAWMWTDMARVSATLLPSRPDDSAYLTQKIEVGRFFLRNQLGDVEALARKIRLNSDGLMTYPAHFF